MKSPDQTSMIATSAELDLGAFENKTAWEVLEWSQKRFHPHIAFASSFGAEDVVVMDMLAKINPAARIITLDTGRLPGETYDLMERLRQRYGLSIEACVPERQALEEMVREHGPNLFYKSVEMRKLCCKIRKVEPLKGALSTVNAWITGLRREQAVTRSDVKKVEIDESYGSIVKVNPLNDWTTQQVWDYIRQNNVPYNALHDQGYPSLGCAPCTRAILPGEDLRAGRWWWESPEQKECGLHEIPGGAGPMGGRPSNGGGSRPGGA